MKPNDPEPTAVPDPIAARPATLPQVIGTVFSSFLGIRRRSAMQSDAVSVKPVQVILVGVLLAAGLVVGLLLLVRVIMSQT